jgi:hypothetical protein
MVTVDNPTEGGNTPVGGGAPIGSGIAILLLLGVAYGRKKFGQRIFAATYDRGRD